MQQHLKQQLKVQKMKILTLKMKIKDLQLLHIQNIQNPDFYGQIVVMNKTLMCSILLLLRFQSIGN